MHEMPIQPRMGWIFPLTNTAKKTREELELQYDKFKKPQVFQSTATVGPDLLSKLSDCLENALIICGNKLLIYDVQQLMQVL